MLKNGVADYFLDPWNCIDATTLITNFIFLLCITMNQCSEGFIIDEYAIRRLGAFCCFFMWIKIFYWMRLFEPLAKYVSLIIKTIIDCIWFIALVFIIILSFTSYFYVTNQNIEDMTDGEKSYIPSYTSGETPTLFDTFLSVYFMCIGMYDVTPYG